ncbi:MAG: AsmA family protein [Pseudomonadota bacterium]
MLRILIRIVAFVVIVAVALVGSVFLISGERLASIVSDEVTKATGRDVRISETARPQLFPDLGIRTGAFQIAGFSADEPLISGESLSVSVDLRSLLSGEINVREISLDAPVVTLEKRQNGAANWASESATDAEASDSNSSLPEFTLSALSIQDGTLRYIDRTSDTDIAISDLDLAASMPAIDAPLTADVGFSDGGQRVSAQIELSSLRDLIAGNPVTTTFEAEAGPNAITYSGTATTDGILKGALTAKVADPSALSALAGAGSVEVPDEILPVSLAGNLSVAPDQIGIEQASIGLGSNQLLGNLTVELTEVPFVAAALSSQALDLSFLTAEEGSATEPVAGTGWSTDEIDASAVGLLNANIQIKSSQVDLGATEITDANLALTIDQSRAVAEITEAQAFGGALTGRFVVNNRNGLSVGGAMDGKTVAIQALLTDLAGFERMRGAGNATLSFLGVGQSLDQIMRSLSGKGSLDIGAGEITGFDLAALFSGNDALSDATTTIFKSLSGTFTMKDGVLRNGDLEVLATLFQATGTGEIDLGRQTLDYVITPKIFDLAGAGGVAIPVRFDGPWASPRIYPDLEALAKEKLRIEQERLEAIAQERLAAEKAKLEQRLEDEKSRIEDEVKDRLENELEKGLRGLLGGN